MRLGRNVKDDPASINSATQDVVHPSEIGPLFQALEWLLADSPIRKPPPIPSQPTAPIELFTTLLAHKLRYEPHERDMVVLHHEQVAKSAEADAVEDMYTAAGKPTTLSLQLTTYTTPISRQCDQFYYYFLTSDRHCPS
jgi:alpha-aminoadipic semialdehyde synthase